jgi:hypothetical protein
MKRAHPINFRIRIPYSFSLIVLLRFERQVYILQYLRLANHNASQPVEIPDSAIHGARPFPPRGGVHSRNDRDRLPDDFHDHGIPLQ